MEELKWIVTDGGPLLLISAESRGEWDGSRPWKSGKPVASVARRYGGIPNTLPTDFERAANVHAYAASIQVVPGKDAVVLGFDVCPVAILIFDLITAFVVRVVTTDEDEEGVSTEALRQALETIPEEAWDAETQRIRLQSGRFAVMDSGDAGDAVPDNLIIEARLDPGDYTVSTCVFNSSDETRLIVHRLLKQ